jgi:hypothetical protein
MTSALNTKKGGRKMRNNFYPAKPFMLREIEKCIEAGNLDTLMIFCKSCVFNLCIKSNEPACRTCLIKQGISKTTGLRIISKMRKTEEILSEVIEVIKSDAHADTMQTE